MEILIKILGLGALSFLFVTSTPTTMLRIWLFNKIYKGKYYEGNLIWKLITCSLCSGFWIGLIFTGDILIASLVSVIAEMICRKLSSGSL